MSEKIDFKAFDDGGADQVLRGAMSGHRVEPRPGLWKGISRKLLWKELLHFNFTNVSPKGWIAGSVILLLVSTALYVGFRSTSSENALSEPVVGTTQPGHIEGNSIPKHTTSLLTTSRHAGTESPVAITRSADQPSIVKSAGTVSTHHQNQHPGISATREPSLEAVMIASTSKPGSLNEQGLAFRTSEPAGQETALEIMHVVPYEASLLAGSGSADTIITITNPAGIVKFRKGKPQAVSFFSANLGITPEQAFYSEPETYSKTNYWVNGMVTYHLSRFSLATGFGLGYVFDEGKYKVEYKSRDSIGYFTGVMSYTVGNNNEIVYNTQSVSVYDSLNHLGDYRTKNRYTYLQVPLLLGYRIFESNRMSLTFQAGPALSILLGSRMSDPVIEYQNARIIRVDNDTPTRVQANFQVWANLYFEMRMNKTVSIYLEPTFKYFLKPAVEQENVKFKAPLTIGLGVGLQFNFGQKTKTP